MAALTLAATLPIAGCAGRNALYNLPVASPGSSAAHLHGRAHGGQNPVSGSTIQVYEIGTSGTGSASLAVTNATATTDANGNFTLPTYSCDYNSLIYVTATGGNPGLTSGTNNSAIALMAAVGPCTYYNSGGYYSLDPNSFINLNEVTTAATVYALAPFMVDITHIGSTGNLYGITNAFATASMLVDISAGIAPGPALSTAVTYDPNTGFPVLLNTLGNILASCVNSASSTGGACSSLFTATTNNGQTPSDISGAMLSIVKNPGQNVSTIFQQVSPFKPFAPSLTNAPSDFTLALNYTGLNLSIPKAIAFDSTSDIFIVSQGQQSITEIASATNYTGQAPGNISQYNLGLIGPQALAIDQSDHVWIANTGGNSVVVSDKVGNILSGSGYTAGGINAPISIAMDTTGNAWIANFNGNSLTRLGNDGTPAGFSPLTVGYNSIPISLPIAVAVDGNNDVWVSNTGLGSNGLLSMTLEFDYYANPLTCQNPNPLLAGPRGLAVDNSNNVWIAGNEISSVQTYANSCGNNFGTGLVSGGGLSQPSAVAIDGNNTIWAANSITSGSLSEIAAGNIQAQAGNGAILSPPTGLGKVNAPDAIAVDASGNVWTANAGDNSLTEFVGVAAPTATPIVSALP